MVVRSSFTTGLQRVVEHPIHFKNIGLQRKSSTRYITSPLHGGGVVSLLKEKLTHEKTLDFASKNYYIS